jgi:putative ABC transport system ATP-binding protein
MVTHDPRAAAIADRILFLADGVIVRDLGRTEAHEVIAVTESSRDDTRSPQRTLGASSERF